MNITKFETQATMTLKEITDLLEVRHNDAMKTVAKMAESPEFGMITEISYSSEMPNGGSKTYTTYQLDKRQSMAVAARLNVSLMMRIIDRWQELEEQESGKFRIPQTLSEALRLAADQAEIIEIQKLKIEEDKPKVMFAEAVEGSVNSISVGMFSKILDIKGLGQNNLFKWFREEGYLMDGGRQHNCPYQRYVTQGLFEIKESVIPQGGENVVKPTTLVTGKGQTYFTKKLISMF